MVFLAGGIGKRRQPVYSRENVQLLSKSKRPSWMRGAFGAWCVRFRPYSSVMRAGSRPPSPVLGGVKTLPLGGGGGGDVYTGCDGGGAVVDGNVGVGIEVAQVIVSCCVPVMPLAFAVIVAVPACAGAV